MSLPQHARRGNLDLGLVRVVAAVLHEPPEDRDRDVPEEESFTWAILTEDNWNAEAVMGWRWSKAELKRRKEQPQQKRQRGHGRDD